MERWQAKLLALFGSFVLPLLLTMLPYKVSGYVSKKGKQGKVVLSYLMCFGGGIFFGTFLLHMGPEVHVLVSTSLLIPYEIQYPLADLFVGIGFFLVLFSEKFALKWNKRRMRNRSSRRRRRRQAAKAAAGDGPRNGASYAPCSPCSNSTAPVDGFFELTTEREGGFHGNEEGNGVWRRPTKDEESAPSNTNAAAVGLMVYGADPTNDDDNDCDKRQEEEEQEEQEQEEQHQHAHHSVRSIILILALSMHRIFEGMTIGLQGSVHNIWSLFLAVMCHELVIGFSLGLQLVKSRLSLRRMTTTSVVCSAIMPLGVSVGIVLTELGREGRQLAMANGVLQAVAMGTFIYVTFFEILQEEVDPNDASLAKIFFIFSGFVMMALLDLIPEETPPPPPHEPLLGNYSAMATAQPTTPLSWF